MRNKSGIYSITHNATGKMYVGSAVNIGARWAVHRHRLDADNHHNRNLQRAWNKYGKQAFTFSVTEFVEDISTLVAREQFRIDEAKACGEIFNASLIAGSTLGVKYSAEVKARLSSLALSRKPPSLETREKMSAALRLRKGEKRSDLTKARISEKAKGRVLSIETRAKISASAKPKSEAHLAKIVAQNKARSGIPMSQESRMKMSVAAKARVARSIRDSSGRFGAGRGVNFGQGA